MLPKSYREQESCSTCAMCYVMCQQDEDTDYYCDKDDNRPLSGIVRTEECWLKSLEKRGFTRDDNSQEYLEEFEKLSEAWASWEKEHMVCANGICDEHKPKEKHEN